METYIKKAEDLEAVNTNFIPPLLESILGDYGQNVPAARDAEVLNVMATITSRLGVCVLFQYLRAGPSFNAVPAFADSADSANSGCRF